MGQQSSKNSDDGVILRCSYRLVWHDIALTAGQLAAFTIHNHGSPLLLMNRSAFYFLASLLILRWGCPHHPAEQAGKMALIAKA